jgi:AraC-like DNA-binding protein
MQSHLYIWNDRFLYTAPAHSSDLSSRYTATILLTGGGSPLTIGFDDGDSESGAAVLVAPHVRRSLKVPEGGFFSINFDAHSLEFRSLTRLLRGRRLAILDTALFTPFQGRLLRLLEGHLACNDAFTLASDIASSVAGEEPEPFKIDLRVLHVARRLKSELPHPPSLSDLARNVGLSPDRLSHLFAEQLGLTIKSYTLWVKMRRASVLLQSGHTLTEVSHAVGFADSAHLSRTYKTFFGLSPSFLADRSWVTLHVCES